MEEASRSRAFDSPALLDGAARVRTEALLDATSSRVEPNERQYREYWLGRRAGTMPKRRGRAVPSILWLLRNDPAVLPEIDGGAVHAGDLARGFCGAANSLGHAPRKFRVAVSLRHYRRIPNSPPRVDRLQGNFASYVSSDGGHRLWPHCGRLVCRVPR